MDSIRPTNRVIGVIDEAGAFRPEEDNTEGFGVGVILFPEEKTDLLVKAAKEIASMAEKEDFKYKHVQKTSRARATFIRVLQTDGLQIFGFYSSKSGVAEKVVRYNKAATLYGRVKLETGKAPTEVLLDMFLGFAMGAIACHALVSKYIADLYWDRRNDMGLMKSMINKHVGKLKSNPRLVGAEEAIRFVGHATAELKTVVRLAGVLAGDLRLYFDTHGERIWKHLDASGLKNPTDPYGTNNLALSSRIVSTMTDLLADPDPNIASDKTVMLQGYYKRFLRHPETNCNLISFCDPYGRMGILEIENGRLWHIRQSAD